LLPPAQLPGYQLHSIPVSDGRLDADADADTDADCDPIRAHADPNTDATSGHDPHANPRAAADGNPHRRHAHPDADPE
jgi:hypothetical protein